MDWNTPTVTILLLPSVFLTLGSCHAGQTNLSGYFHPPVTLFSGFPFHTHTHSHRRFKYCTKRKDIWVALFTLDICQVKRHPSLVCKTPWLDWGLWQVATVCFSTGWFTRNYGHGSTLFFQACVLILFSIQWSHIYIMFLCCQFVFLRNYFAVNHLLFKTTCLCWNITWIESPSFEKRDQR